MVIVVALVAAVWVTPAAAQDGDVVVLPPAGETDVAVLDDGQRVWVVHRADGEVDVLGVPAERLDPDADPYVYGSSFEGIRSFTLWIPEERIFVGPAIVYEDTGVAVGWIPNQVGGAENAGPVPARDLTRYAVERVDEERVRVGQPTLGELRTVPPSGDVGFVTGEVVSPVDRDERPLTVEEALALPVGMTALVETDVEVTAKRSLRLCDLPRVPLPDIPPCPDDAPVPLDATARDPRPGRQSIEFGPHLLTRVEGGFAGLVNGGGSAGSAAPAQTPPLGFDEDPATLDRIEAADPVALAVAISQARFPNGGPFEAILVRVDDPADATTASALTRDAPLLFTERDSLPEPTRQELARVLSASEHQPAGVLLVGGEAAIGSAVASQLEGDGYLVSRAAGPTRVETAIAVAEYARYGSDSIISPVLLARADAPAADPTVAWADSVTAGGYAAFWRRPILLTPPDNLHPAVADALQRFRTEQTVLLGGSAALSSAVEQAVPGPRRMDGANRADTAAAIARDLWTFTSGRALLFDGATTNGWQAGLAAAGLSANAVAPLLIAGDTIPPETTAAIRRLCPMRGGDLLAVGVVASDPSATCDGAAPSEIEVVLTVDSRRSTPEEDARVVVDVANRSDEAIAVHQFQISDETTDAPATIYAPIIFGEVEPLTVPPGATVTVVIVDPMPQSPLNSGSTTAGRYQAAVRTDRGWARATFYVEFSTPLDY